MNDKHQFRANWHNYNEGIFFVTICTSKRAQILGHISNATMQPSALGIVVEAHIKSIPTHYADVQLWNYVMMPNHVHLVLSVGTRFIAPAPATAIIFKGNHVGCLKPSNHCDGDVNLHHNSRLSAVIGAFKAGVTRVVRARRIAPLPCWQSRYHEHIVRNRIELDLIMKYIDNNVATWDHDCFRQIDLD